MLWPYLPAAGSTISLGWLSQVMEAHDGEQRLALRTSPRVSFRLRHRFRAERIEAARLEWRSMTNSLIQIPDWRYPGPLGTIADGTTELSHTAPTAFEVGRDAIIWSTAGTHVAEVSAVGGSTVTLDAGPSGDMPGAILLPLRDAVATGALSIAHRGPGVAEATIDAVATDYPDLSGTSAGSLAIGGTEVLAEPVWRLGDLIETIAQPVLTVDNGTGPIAVEPSRAHMTGGLTVSLRADTPGDLLAIEAFLHRRRGRVVPFWLETGQRDFLPAGNISSGTSIAVTAAGSSAGAAYVGIGLIARTNAGAVWAGKITAASISAGVATLTVSPALSSGIALADLRSLSEASYCRLDADEVEITLGFAGKMSLVIPAARVDNEL